MFSNVFVFHIYSLPCETSVLSLTLTPHYFGANSPDQTCFLTHKPSLVMSLNVLSSHVTKPEDLNIIEDKALWNITQPTVYMNLCEMKTLKGHIGGKAYWWREMGGKN